jgi:hypothetical protein
MRRVSPGSPVRSLGPACIWLIPAAAALPQVRRLDIVDRSGLRLAADQLLGDLEHVLFDDRHRRAERLVYAAIEATAPFPLAVGHGDFHLGNMLVSSGDGVQIVGAHGTADSGFFDAARLAVHALTDGIGSGLHWTACDVVSDVAGAAKLDEDILRVCCAAQAAVSGCVIHHRLRHREWEWQTLDRIVDELT